MSLTSLGRNAVLAQTLLPTPGSSSRTAEEVKADADEKLARTRESVLLALTPWIPGDYVVAYGVLLTAWTEVRGSFQWMLLIAAVLTLSFVMVGLDIR